MPHNNTPTLQTPRLTLRPFRDEDADDYYIQIGSDPDVTRFLRGEKPVKREAMRDIITRRLDHWNQHGYGLWAVTLTATGAFAGQCGLHRLDNTPEVEIAYAIGKAYWGQGMATEAGQTALRFGFESLGLEQIVGVAVAENWASRRVLEKLGMTFRRIAHVYDADLPYYTITRREFEIT